MKNFRCWHKLEKRYIEVNTINYEDEELSFAAYEGFNYSDSIDFKNIIFELSTGLKDRTGVPVFEGDIVSLFYCVGDFVEYKDRAERELNNNLDKGMFICNVERVLNSNNLQLVGSIDIGLIYFDIIPHLENSIVVGNINERA